MASPKNGVEGFASFVSFMAKRGDESSGRRCESVHFCHFWENEAIRAVVEGVKVFIFCHFLGNEALRAVVEGVKVFIFCHV